ncbi:MAG: TlpA family protein disulfide reductase [Bacteroidales bacterium]|nr:TlpA family protein disulfide reductase [Bacteroidales bacterium]
MKHVFFSIMFALVASAGMAQNVDTLAVGMELKLQNTIGTDIFMRQCQTSLESFKGRPSDTASFRLYESRDIVCVIGRDTEEENRYFCSFDLNEDRDFSNDYHYSFNRQQIEDARTFAPQRYGDIWVAPNIFLNGVARGHRTVNSPFAFDGFAPMLHIHDFAVGKFDCHGKTYFVCSAYNKSEFAIMDAIPQNADELAKELLDKKLLREVRFPIVRDSLIFRFLDMDFGRQQCHIGLTPLTDETVPHIPYEGFRAPTISVKDIKGKPASIGDGYTLVDFWGTWCNPCISIVPELVAIHKRYPSLHIISIANESSIESMPKLEKLIKELKMDWTHACELHSDTNRVASDYDVKCFPTTILIAPSGKIVFRGSGTDDIDKLKAKLEECFR